MRNERCLVTIQYKRRFEDMFGRPCSTARRPQNTGVQVERLHIVHRRTLHERSYIFFSTSSLMIAHFSLKHILPISFVLLSHLEYILLNQFSEPLLSELQARQAECNISPLAHVGGAVEPVAQLLN